MSFGQAFRTRRSLARQRRAIDRATAKAATPAMRDDILLASQRTIQSQR